MARPTAELPALQGGGGSDHACQGQSPLTEALSQAQLDGTLSQKLPRSPKARLLGHLALALVLTSSYAEMSAFLTWTLSFYTLRISRGEG